MIFKLLLGKLKPSKGPRWAKWVGNTYPLQEAKNPPKEYLMPQYLSLGKDKINQTVWGQAKLF